MERKESRDMEEKKCKKEQERNEIDGKVKERNEKK